jgi:hypothetical protein
MTKNIVFLFMSLFLALPVHAESFNSDDDDKHLHMMASYSINTAIIGVMPERTHYKKLKAAAMTATVGLTKELTDPKFSSADMVADGIGILASTLLFFTYDF